MTEIRILSAKDVAACLTMDEVIDAVRATYEQKATGEAEAWPMVYHAFEPGVADMDIKSGVLGGFEVVNFKAAVVDGSYHDVDSSEMAYKIAASMAFKEAVKKADPCLMEPMMKVEIIVPEQYMGDVMGNVSSRRGRVDGMEARGSDQIIHAFVPLSEMFGYTTDLRSRTQGRGMFTMQFDHYEEVPKSVAEKIIGAREKNN